MKTYRNVRSSKGFTLIELLVVITIIAILAGLSFAGVNVAIKKAKRTEGLVAVGALKSAVENFYGEYNRLPEAGGIGTLIKTDDGSGQKLLEILLAMENGASAQNSRGIVFLQVKEAKGGRGGLEYGANGDSVQGMYDPFGNPYQVVMKDYGEDVLRASFTGPSGGTESVNVRGAQIAVFSPGGDKEAGTPDDIKTWK